MILQIPRVLKVDSVNSVSQLWIMLGSQDSVVSEVILILSRLSDSAAGRRGSYFQGQAVYLGLRTS